MCGRSGLLLEAWDVQTWGQSGRLGEVWKSERSASESMSLVFGLIVWKRGGVAGQQISRSNECCKTGVLSTFGQKKSLQKKNWFQKAPKLKKQLGGSQVQETGIHRVQLSDNLGGLGFRVYGAKQGTQLHLKSSLREPLHSNLNTVGW